MKNRYYGHTKENEEPSKWQPLIEHLSQVAELAGMNAKKFDCEVLGNLIGMAHDIGKYSQAFQDRLFGSPVKVDHASAGARVLINEGVGWESVTKLLAYPICGHHTGLQDYGNENREGLYQRLKIKELEEYEAYKKEVTINISRLEEVNFQRFTNIDSNYQAFSFAILVKMLYSCLVDADFLDTELFMGNEVIERGGYKSIYEMNEVWKKFLNSLDDLPQNSINKKRKEILNQVLQLIRCKPQLFSLTVPTGGGKTITSMSFALEHAVINQLERIIYVIPFTSIIEQNSKVFKDILGRDQILEHHSNYDGKDLSDEINLKKKLLKSAENWDVPIVVTTNVQFFESLYSNRNASNRKLHNIINSVIILDEAQMLPTDYLRPSVMILQELVEHYNCSVILCTATQPNLNTILPNYPIREMIKDPELLYQYFKRVKVDYDNTPIWDDQLCERLSKEDQVLCIVNTRKHAYTLYQLMEKDESVFHLNTLMCPKHRQKTLIEIKERLNKGQECTVISTQLIEAGVDVDFPIVFRSIAGLDSIVQSAGRCNREGKLGVGNVYVFESLESYAMPKGWLSATASISRSIMKQYKEDIIGIEAIHTYFEQLYDWKQNDLDKYNIINMLNDTRFEFQFKSASKDFRLINKNTYSIIIPYNSEARQYIQDLERAIYVGKIRRQLQPYTVSIYEYEYQKLIQLNILEEVRDGFIVLNDYYMDKYYSQRTGLDIFGQEKLLDVSDFIL